jgi:hypothetical protein
VAASKAALVKDEAAHAGRFRRPGAGPVPRDRNRHGTTFAAGPPLSHLTVAGQPEDRQTEGDQNPFLAGALVD